MAARLQQDAAQLTALLQCEVQSGLDAQLGEWWLHISRWAVPSGLSADHTQLILIVPRQYPLAGPAQLWLPADLRLSSGVAASEAFGGEEGGFWVRCQIADWPWRQGDDVSRTLDLLLVALRAIVAHQELRETPAVSTTPQSDPSTESGDDDETPAAGAGEESVVGDRGGNADD